jgi:hypothetical protein
VKVEQNAIFAATRSDGRRWHWSSDFTRVPPAGLDALRAAAGARRVDEASDGFASVWVGADVIWLEGHGAVRKLDLWTVEDVRERVVAIVRGGG